MSSDYDKVRLAKLLSRESWKSVRRFKNRHGKSAKKRPKQGEWELYD